MPSRKNTPRKPRSRSPENQGRTNTAQVSRTNLPKAAIGDSSKQVLRRAPRQRRALATMDAIVTAAGQLLVSQGYEASSTNAIAKRAGVSVGSLYQYFSTKEDVFRELLRRHHQEVEPLVKKMLIRMADPSEDLVEIIQALLHELVSLHERSPALMRAIDTELGWLERAQRDKNVVPHSVEVTSRVLLTRGDLGSEHVKEISYLLVEVSSHLARWLAHSVPNELDKNVLISRVGRMMSGLLGTSEQPNR